MLEVLKKALRIFSFPFSHPLIRLRILLEPALLKFFKLLDVYLFGNYSTYFLVSSIFMTGIFGLLEIVGMANAIVASKTPLKIVLTYFALRFPYWFIQLAPVASLLSVFFTMGALVRERVFYVLLSSGISARRIYLPFFVASLLVSLSQLYVAEFVVPDFNWKARELKRIYVDRSGTKVIRHDITLYGKKDTFYRIKKFDLSSATMWGVKIYRKKPEAKFPEFHLTAKKGRYIDGKWYFYYGVYRKFNEEGDIVEAREFGKKGFSIPLSEKPGDFVRERLPDEMRAAQLLRRIRKEREMGQDVAYPQTIFYLRYAFAYNPIILVPMGFAISTNVSSAMVLTGFSATILISFVFYVFLAVGFILSIYGRIHPALGAFLGSIVFTVISVYMFFFKTKT